MAAKFQILAAELAWRSGCVMDCHATAQGSIPGRNGVKTELHVLRKGLWGLPSLNDLAVDGTLNTTNQPTNIKYLQTVGRLRDVIEGLRAKVG